MSNHFFRCFSFRRFDPSSRRRLASAGDQWLASRRRLGWHRQDVFQTIAGSSLSYPKQDLEQSVAQ